MLNICVLFLVNNRGRERERERVKERKKEGELRGTTEEGREKRVEIVGGCRR